MFNNIGLPGLITVIIIFGIPVLVIWLVVRSFARSAAERKRMADALEEIAKTKDRGDRT